MISALTKSTTNRRPRPLPSVNTEAPVSDAAQAQDTVRLTSEQTPPQRSVWRTIATEAAHWTRRAALTVAAPFAAIFNVGLGSSPAGLTGADELHKQGIDGRGTRVAVIDQAFTQFGAGQEDVVGVYQTRDKTFKPGLEKAKFNPGQEMATKKKPISTHGNAMSAIITGESRGLKGVAPGAELIGISVIDDTQTLQTELFVDALDWVAKNHHEYDIKAVSASVNYKNPSVEERQQAQRHVNYLKDRGVAVVVAAGNDGPELGTVRFPADLDNVISVGASTPGWMSGTWDDRVERYSSRGSDDQTGPTLLAPGGSVFTKDGHGSVDLTSGSSNSTPMVAGAYALLTQGYPAATYEQKVEALTSTAQPIKGDRASEGHGVMNIPESYKTLASTQ
jgi:serine protease AprX